MDETTRNSVPLRGSPRDQSAHHSADPLDRDSFGGFTDAFTLVCFWCRQVIRPGGPKKSRGICPACKTKLQDEGWIDR